MNSKSTPYIIALLVVSFLLILYLMFDRRQPPPLSPLNEPLPFPTKVLLKNIPPQNNFFSPFGKTTIQKTTGEEIEKRSDIIGKEIRSDGSSQYTIKSVSAFHPDAIIVEKNTVVFEKTTTFTNNNGGLPQIIDYVSVYGEPEEKIKGTKEYGAFTTTYLYPTKGFVFIANEETQNIYAIMRFPNMSITDFKTKYGIYVEQANYIEE